MDWTHLAAQPHTPDPERLRSAWDHLNARFRSGEIGFFSAPIDESISHLNDSRDLATSLRASGKFKNCLFLGIGGSALGPISLLQALTCEIPDSAPKMHFMENPDGAHWKQTLRALDPDTTLVCVVTKSGTTFETLALFLLTLDWLGQSRWKTHIVAISDPAQGDLTRFSREQGIPLLPIAPSVGGRFSIFTPVGLFAAELCGISGKDFLNGAAQVRAHTEKTPPERNPHFLVASHLLSQYPKRSVHVCMPYSSQLRSVSQWWVQLWGESLGKDGKGFTPVQAVGAIDQHSILQLLRDGPDDKVTCFIKIDRPRETLKIPRLSGAQIRLPPAFFALEGCDLHALLNTECSATSLVLTRRSRPNWTLALDELNARSLGALYFSQALMTAFIGTLWEINPFDQPGVEEGKIYIREALERMRNEGLDQAKAQDQPNAADRLRYRSDQ